MHGFEGAAVLDVKAELRVRLPGADKLVCVRINSRSCAHKYVHGGTMLSRNRTEHGNLLKVVQDNVTDARADRHLKLVRGLVVAMKIDSLRRKTGFQRDVKLAAGRDIQVKAFFLHDTAHGHGVEGFSREADYVLRVPLLKCSSKSAAIPANEDIRRKSANYDIVGRPGSTWGPLFEELAANVAEAPPLRPKPLTQDALLGLFKGEVVGRNVVLEPASHEDMCGSSHVEKPTLEIVYDNV